MVGQNSSPKSFTEACNYIHLFNLIAVTTLKQSHFSSAWESFQQPTHTPCSICLGQGVCKLCDFSIGLGLGIYGQTRPVAGKSHLFKGFKTIGTKNEYVFSLHFPYHCWITYKRFKYLQIWHLLPWCNLDRVLRTRQQACLARCQERHQFVPKPVAVCFLHLGGGWTNPFEKY